MTATMGGPTEAKVPTVWVPAIREPYFETTLLFRERLRCQAMVPVRPGVKEGCGKKFTGRERRTEYEKHYVERHIIATLHEGMATTMTQMPVRRARELGYPV